MTAPRCLFCGSRPIERHHVTGRPGPDGPYLDELFVIPLCPACHAREHVVLRSLGIEFLPGGADPLIHRGLRLTVHLGRLADEGRSLVLDPTSVRACWTLLLEVIAALGALEGVSA